MYSIIVPYWNSEQWLARCCQSLTRQTGDFEVLLVNDNSTDNGKAITSEYASRDARFILLDNERTKGVSGARNTGLDHAQGEWVTFLDADDEMVDDVCNTFDMMTKQTNAKIIQFNHVRYYSQIDKLAMKYTNAGGRYSINNMPVHWFGVWNKLFRQDVAECVRFDEELQYGEDGLFVLACMAKTDIIEHAPKRYATVKHRFDNRQSLSKTKTFDALLFQIHKYEAFMLDQTDIDLKLFMCSEIARLWASPHIEKTLKSTQKP